jgi:phasin family protein
MADNNSFNPFANMDFGKFDVSQIMQDLKVPGIDVNALMEAQRKNIEAVTAANKAAIDGMQSVAKRQAEIMAQSFHEVSNLAQEFSASSTNNPQEMGAKQAEIVKQAFDKALGNMRELAEMVSKTNTEAFEVMNKRFTESLEELKGLMGKNPQ